jgi:hypothetical protein
MSELGFLVLRSSFEMILFLADSLDLVRGSLLLFGERLGVRP